LIAFCAPGRKLEAALTLMFRGETVSEIRETPLLEGQEGTVILADEKLMELASGRVAPLWPVTAPPPAFRDWATPVVLKPGDLIRLSGI
jgi:hypothetical protein